MVKFLKLKVGDVVYQRSRSIRLGPSAVPIEILSIHADYANVRKGVDQPPCRMYRKELEYLHWTPFPVPSASGGGAANRTGPSSVRYLRDQARALNARNEGRL